MVMEWTVDYGDGTRPVRIPHVWHLERPVTWEGPATYRVSVEVPDGEPHLIFHGVSFEAVVSINGQQVLTHCGIWDAFALDLTPWAGSSAEIEVEVTKNGGQKFPVKSVASGFIPYVFNTFGGIFRPVELVQGKPDLHSAVPDPRVKIENGRIIADGKPFYMRGILSWGWYPETASPHPSLDVIQKEIDQIQELGFNTVKFCLWLPPHEYLEELDKRGMWGWIELPIWMPDPAHLDAMREECLEIVRQYRRHSNIIAWTAGCELSEGVPPEWRREFVERIFELTGHPLIKDNSGGAEMYGGHPEEFGTFNDFHPYCEPMFYPEVLASLADGPRAKVPTLLGEFNDYDVVRPLHQQLVTPYWASPKPELNDQGVRWQYDLPRILGEMDGELGDWLDGKVDNLICSSKSQGEWMREKAFDAVRMQADFDGWVLTGLRHTPISTSGVIGDDGDYFFDRELVFDWNADQRLMLIPRRTPPWVNGGNRPGWENPQVRFEGPSLFQAALHSVEIVEARLEWSIGEQSGSCKAVTVHPLDTSVIGEFVVDLSPGFHRLRLELCSCVREFEVNVFAKSNPVYAVSIPPASGTVPRPAFRECCYWFELPEWSGTGWRDNWEVLSMVVPDQFMTRDWLDTTYPGWEPLLTRLDTRTFERTIAVARTKQGIITTLNPHGGLGNQAIGIERNPAGQDLKRLFKKMEESA